MAPHEIVTKGGLYKTRDGRLAYVHEKRKRPDGTPYWIGQLRDNPELGHRIWNPQGRDLLYWTVEGREIPGDAELDLVKAE